MLWSFYSVVCFQSYLKHLILILLVVDRTPSQSPQTGLLVISQSPRGHQLVFPKVPDGEQRSGPARLAEAVRAALGRTPLLQGLQRKLGFLSSVAVKNVQAGWLKLLWEDAMNTRLYVVLASLFRGALKGASMLA